MKAHLGEEGTEQFTVTTYVDDKMIGEQAVHDPFIHSTATLSISRWHLLKALFKKEFRIKVAVNVWGSAGAQRAIMTLDPERLAKDTEEILHERKISREMSAATGLCVSGS